MAKGEKKRSSKKQIRWEVDEDTYRKIGVYQKSFGLSSLEAAGNILLKKATIDIILPTEK